MTADQAVDWLQNENSRTEKRSNNGIEIGNPGRERDFSARVSGDEPCRPEE